MLASRRVFICKNRDCGGLKFTSYEDSELSTGSQSALMHVWSSHPNEADPESMIVEQQCPTTEQAKAARAEDFQHDDNGEDKDEDVELANTVESDQAQNKGTTEASLTDYQIANLPVVKIERRRTDTKMKENKQNTSTTSDSKKSKVREVNGKPTTEIITSPYFPATIQAGSKSPDRKAEAPEVVTVSDSDSDIPLVTISLKREVQSLMEQDIEDQENIGPGSLPTTEHLEKTKFSKKRKNHLDAQIVKDKSKWNAKALRAHITHLEQHVANLSETMSDDLKFMTEMNEKIVELQSHRKTLETEMVEHKRSEIRLMKENMAILDASAQVLRIFTQILARAEPERFEGVKRLDLLKFLGVQGTGLQLILSYAANDVEVDGEDIDVSVANGGDCH